MVKSDYDLSISNILQSIILLMRAFCCISKYRAVASFFMVVVGGGGWVKMPASMVCQRQKILKSQWLKWSKTGPKKRNLDQKIND